MYRVLTADQMRTADKHSIEVLGLTKSELVNRAGNAIANEIITRFLGGRVLVVIGTGNNGADGRIVASVLKKQHGFNVSVFDILKPNFSLFDKKYDIVIDCLLGTGLNRAVEGVFSDVITRINSLGALVVACDVPSGLNGNNGLVMGNCVKANLTIAIGERKTGYYLNDGIDYTGEIVCVDIGISVWDDDVVNILEDVDIRPLFLPRKHNVHKGCFPKAVVMGGSKNYSGSVLLSNNALLSLKTGLGYSNLVVPEEVFKDYIGINPECILTPFSSSNGYFIFDVSQLDKLLKYDAIAFGMGAGVTEENYNILKFFLQNYKNTLIIDADGLNTLSKFGTNVLKNKKCKVVLTPHIQEFSRLAQIDKKEIIANPIKVAKDFAKEFNVILLLKSATSVITDGDAVFINITGCSGLAKGGSGDVLSGILAGITAREKETIFAVASSSYLFGLAGEIVSQNQNDYTITASDVIQALPSAINNLTN